MLVMCRNKLGFSFYININHVVAIYEMPDYPGSLTTHYIVEYSNGKCDNISDADASKLVGKMHI